MHLFVMPGHGAGDCGACGYGYEEAERVRALATRIKELGGDQVVLGDFSRNYYADNGWSTQYFEDDWQAVELHMDSAGEGAHGAHVIYCGLAEPDCFDEELARRISEFFPGRANTLVGRTDLKNPKLAYRRGIPYRLIENGFISDWDDLVKFNANIDALARLYLEVFGILGPSEDKEVEPETKTEAEPVETSSGTDVGIEVDGWWGRETTTALQRHFGTPVDGEVWHQWDRTCSHERHVGGWCYDRTGDGSSLVRSMQAEMGVDVDGLWGPDCRAALMSRYSVREYPEAVARMQDNINHGRF